MKFIKFEYSKHETKFIFYTITLTVPLSMKKFFFIPWNVRTTRFSVHSNFLIYIYHFFLNKIKERQSKENGQRIWRRKKNVLSINISGLFSAPSRIFVQFDRKNLLISAQVKNFIHYEKYNESFFRSFFLNTEHFFFINFKETSVPTFVLIASVQILAELSGGLLSYIIT